MKTPSRGGFVTGLVIGLLIGLGVALAVALYITKAPVPFINKLPQRSADQDAAEVERNKAWDPNAPLAGRTPARPAATASGTVAGGAPTAPTDPTPAAAPVPAPRPVAAASAAAPVASAARRDPGAILAGQTPAAGASAARGAAPSANVAPVAAFFFVQAGAYARPDDADAQRAKLALLGLSARITEREQAGRTVYRVRLGPFDTREPAEDAQAKLAGAGIEANLVRVER
jgi:cell division protein FtsN